MPTPQKTMLLTGASRGIGHAAVDFSTSTVGEC